MAMDCRLCRDGRGGVRCGVAGRTVDVTFGSENRSETCRCRCRLPTGSRVRMDGVARRPCQRCPGSEDQTCRGNMPVRTRDPSVVLRLGCRDRWRSKRLPPVGGSGIRHWDPRYAQGLRSWRDLPCPRTRRGPPLLTVLNGNKVDALHRQRQRQLRGSQCVVGNFSTSAALMTSTVRFARGGITRKACQVSSGPAHRRRPRVGKRVPQTETPTNDEGSLVAGTGLNPGSVFAAER